MDFSAYQHCNFHLSFSLPVRYDLARVDVWTAFTLTRVKSLLKQVSKGVDGQRSTGSKQSLEYFPPQPCCVIPNYLVPLPTDSSLYSRAVV